MTITAPGNSWRERLSRLSAAQLRALADRLGIAGEAGAPGRRGDRLVACVVTARGQTLDGDALRGYARERLADYMVPQLIVPQEALPRTATGKLDRDALGGLQWLAPAEADPGEFVAPASETETTLAGIWAEVLGLDEVSVHDDFFEVGGDSLLSIRILARANRAGLRISPEQFFSHPTIATQACLAEPETQVSVQHGPVTGVAPLTPIQHWFFERITVEPQHWNQASLFRVAQGVSRVALERAIHRLVNHHDALRSRFVIKDGALHQEFLPTSGELPVDWVELRDTDAAGIGAAVRRCAQDTHLAFSLDQGPLIRFVYFTTPDRVHDHLLIVAHHLIVDAVSWRILTEDLDTLLTALVAGQQPELPDKSTALKDWALRLAAHRSSAGVTTQFEYWCGSDRGVDVPVDFEANLAANLQATRFTVTANLDEDETEHLLTDVPRAFRSRINDSLLAALAATLTGWTGAAACRFDLEGHGREPFADDLDLSRTVGWLTTVFPVVLVVGDGPQPAALLSSVKEQLRTIPERGFGYGLLRYPATDDEFSRGLKARPASRVCFNYLGQVDQMAPDTRALSPVAQDIGASRAPAGRRAYLIDLDARIESGRLIVDCGASDKFHRRDTMEKLVGEYLAALRNIIAAAEAGEATAAPGDFPLADLDAGELEGLSRLLDAIDDAD